MYDRLLIDITSPYGDKGGTHPKVVNFRSPWNGYRYWMAYSPYPHHNAKYENPVIIASNNLVDWEYPNSPIEKNILDDSYINEKMYNSDPHLVYNPGNDTLEAWWRLVNDINNNVTIYRRCSKNGITWSAREIMLYSNDRKAQDFVSPSILIIDNNYYIYYVHRRQIHLLTLVKCQDNNVYTISAPKVLDIVDNECSPWHIDVIFHNGKIIIVYCGYLKKNGWTRRFPMHLYLVHSNSFNRNFSSPECILRTEDCDLFNNLSIYRSSIICEDNRLILIYSGFSKDDTANLGLHELLVMNSAKIISSIR